MNINNNNNNESTNVEIGDSNFGEFMQKFLNDYIISIDGEEYMKENDRLRKIITLNEEKFNLIWKAHAVGHEGFEKTYERLKKSFYWKGMTIDIRRFISNCTLCQMRKRNEIPDATENFATEVEAPFTHLGLDIIGPLPIISRGNQYILVIVDYFTKWVDRKLHPQLLPKTWYIFFQNFLLDLVHPIQLQ